MRDIVKRRRLFQLVCGLAAVGVALFLVLGGGGAGASPGNGKGGGQPSGDTSAPQPASNADYSGHGANVHGPYDSTRDGSASQNGNGNGKAVGKPCAGCVGKADNKNPPGQLPGGSDNNAGYECDRNHGVGRSNPAHTGCTPSTTPPSTGPSTPSSPPGGGSSTPPNGGGSSTPPNGGGSTSPGTPPGHGKPSAPSSGSSSSASQSSEAAGPVPSSTAPQPGSPNATGNVTLPSSLAHTGAGATPGLVAAGIALVLLGCAALGASRRRAGHR